MSISSPTKKIKKNARKNGDKNSKTGIFFVVFHER